MRYLPDDAPSWLKSPAGMALVVAVPVGGFYLLTEHTAHVLGALPYLLLLACPLMHLFMHHGHRHGSHSGSQRWSGDDEQHGR